jgi:hypothetical protein
MQPAWYAKSGRAQRRALEKIMGTYRPRASDPIALPTSRNDVRGPGTLKDYHESEKVRRRNTEADALIKAAAPAPIMQAPVAAPEPIMGYCRECHKALPRYGIRADAKFCSDAHSKAFRRREANREILNAAFKGYRAKSDTAGWPGEIPYYYLPPAPEPATPLSCRQAILTNRVAEYLQNRRKALAA